ncbi:hypothetical protein NL676_023141 [Syzygium grande]|nr:hypothetical protein NL676_023141 [Syzygium grande]
MAYVDHAFSISDEDMMMDSPYAVNSRAPIKEIALAVSLLVVGTLGILGTLMASYRVGGDRTHGVFFTVLDSWCRGVLHGSWFSGLKKRIS